MMIKKEAALVPEKPVLAACDSCNGRTYGDPEITPGIQKATDRNLQFESPLSDVYRILRDQRRF